MGNKLDESAKNEIWENVEKIKEELENYNDIQNKEKE